MCFPTRLAAVQHVSGLLQCPWYLPVGSCHLYAFPLHLCLLSSFTSTAWKLACNNRITQLARIPYVHEAFPVWSFVWSRACQKLFSTCSPLSLFLGLFKCLACRSPESVARSSGGPWELCLGLLPPYAVIPVWGKESLLQLSKNSCIPGSDCKCTLLDLYSYIKETSSLW